MTREEALTLVKSHTNNQNLVRHMLAVEAVMRALARHFDEDEESWGLAGLLHDADYEEAKDNPKLHTKMTLKWLEKYGVPEEVKDAILAHGWKYVEDSPKPKNKMEWSLYTCDELTGLIVAVALVKGKNLSSVKVNSIMKKWNQKSFAAGANRSQIELCDKELGIKLEKFIQIALEAMQKIAPDLGL